MVRMINLEALLKGYTFDDGIRNRHGACTSCGSRLPRQTSGLRRRNPPQDRRCRVNIHSKFEGYGVSRGLAPVRVLVPAGGDAEQKNLGRPL